MSFTLSVKVKSIFLSVILLSVVKLCVIMLKVVTYFRAEVSMRFKRFVSYTREVGRRQRRRTIHNRA
jgi:hypothetical protein